MVVVWTTTVNRPCGLPLPGACDGVEDYGGSRQASSFHRTWKWHGECCRAKPVGSGGDFCSGRAGPVVVHREGVPGEAASEGSGSRHPATIGRPGTGARTERRRPCARGPVETGGASSGAAGTQRAHWTTCPPETGRSRTGGRAQSRPSVTRSAVEARAREGGPSGSQISAHAASSRGARRSSWTGKARGTAGQVDLFAPQASSRAA
jgi:hypothetical protein